MKAVKIKMKAGCRTSNNLTEIDEIYITGCTNPGYFKKAVLHDYVKKNPGSIQVDIWPNSNVVDAVSANGEKYVRSSPNAYGHDNLLSLPRE